MDRSPPPLGLADLFRLETRAEIAEMFPEVPRGILKAEAFDLLKESHADFRSFEDWRASIAERVYFVTIPAAHLRRCFDRLLSNLHENRSGLPDLIQFWVAEKRYRMIEVKGPGDRIQDNQQRWIHFCLRHQIPVAVCHVRWA